MKESIKANIKKEVKYMLLNYSVKGFKVFYDEVSFSMVANNYIKKNKENIIENDGVENVVKSSFIYGPNNVGKSCFIESIKFLIDLIINESFKTRTYTKNFFYKPEDPIIFKVDYLINDNLYNYELHLNVKEIQEEILKENGKIILDRSNPSEEIQKIFELLGLQKDRLYVFLLPKRFSPIGENLKKFAESFVFFDSAEKIDVEEVLKPENFETISNMVKNCDFQINEIVDNTERFNKLTKVLENSQKEMLSIPDEYRISTKFQFKDNEIEVPLLLINSLGTKKFMKLTYTFLNAIRDNKIIIIDEFESSLHTIISKTLISFFNSYNNKRAQLIATTHDLLLLDDDYLLRKDQIWFIHKDQHGNYLYCLNDFKDNQENDPRGNIMIKYLKGLFGALPRPTLFD